MVPEAEDEPVVAPEAKVEPAAASDVKVEPAGPRWRPEMGMDDAMAWLESLAAKQGADEETLLTRPEERMETPPEWVSQAFENVQPATTVAESPALACSPCRV